MAGKMEESALERNGKQFFNFWSEQLQGGKIIYSVKKHNKRKYLGMNLLSLQNGMIINDCFQNKFSFSSKKIAFIYFFMVSLYLQIVRFITEAKQTERSDQ